MDNLKSTVETIADMMVVSAITAPKGKGLDNIYAKRFSDKEIESVIKKMREVGETENRPGCIRDAGNLEKAQALVVIGCKNIPVGINCSFCGYKDCAELKANNGICCFSITDLGIAIGSAVKTASYHNVDNRVMYTIGYSVLKMDILPEDIIIAHGIPLSASAKNIFFDRK